MLLYSNQPLSKLLLSCFLAVGAANCFRIFHYPFKWLIYLNRHLMAPVWRAVSLYAMWWATDNKDYYRIFFIENYLQFRCRFRASPSTSFACDLHWSTYRRLPNLRNLGPKPRSAMNTCRMALRTYFHSHNGRPSTEHVSIEPLYLLARCHSGNEYLVDISQYLSRIKVLWARRRIRLEGTRD